MAIVRAVSLTNPTDTGPAATHLICGELATGQTVALFNDTGPADLFDQAELEAFVGHDSLEVADRLIGLYWGHEQALYGRLG